MIGHEIPPFEPTNIPRVEFMYEILEGLPDVWKKYFIVSAALEDVEILTPEQATEMLASLGLKGE